MIVWGTFKQMDHQAEGRCHYKTILPTASSEKDGSQNAEFIFSTFLSFANFNKTQSALRVYLVFLLSENQAFGNSLNFLFNGLSKT